jgi:hypothetical protein
MNLAAAAGDQCNERRCGAGLDEEKLVMGRAIAAISGSAAALLPRPFGRIGPAAIAYWRDLTRALFNPYRPELHYMRGPGPAWRAKHNRKR